MIFKDYYKILGLESNKVSTNDIKVAYREQAKKYHPDVNIGNRNTEERFKDINEAYNILSNPATRKRYDRNWNARIGRKKAKKSNNQKSKLSTVDFIKQLFGISIENKQKKKDTKEQKIPSQGENVETSIEISVIEGFFGLDKEISLRTIDGKMKKFDVKIPAGIRDGEKIRLIGQGRPGKNGGKNGDLLIRININDNQGYKLVGSDIYTNVNIAPWEAVLGTKIFVNAIDETINVYIPKGSNLGDSIKIENKGYRDVKTGGRGSFIINIHIAMPKNISKEEEKLYKQLKKLAKKG